MKIPWTATASTLLCCVLVSSSALNATSKTLWNAETEQLIKKRIAHLQLPFQVSYTSEITEDIRLYLVNGKRQTERILGRAEVFFPIFEHNLVINGLPKELRYLPIIESELRPYVKSPAGAAGLWQFVPATARHYGIEINRVVDERLDPYRSTEAAVKLLKALYAEYCDWSLVLAAYNCGTIRVNKAIRQAGSTEYHKIKKYLPRETKDYQLRYVAASYVANYYAEHGLQARRGSLNFENLRTLKVHEQLTFKEITEATGLDNSTIKRLNPGYLKGILPTSKRGNYLVLPSRQLIKVTNYLRDAANKTAYQFIPSNSFEKRYTVAVGDHLGTIAERFGCYDTEIMAWNDLATTHLAPNQEIFLFFKPEVRRRARA